jgi:hypothetical protein
VIRVILLAWLLFGGTVDTQRAQAAVPAPGAPPIVRGTGGEEILHGAKATPESLETDPRTTRLRIPPGRERLARRLLSDIGFLETLAGDWHFDAIAIGHRQLTLELRRVADPDDGPAIAGIHLDPVAVAQPHERTSKSFVLRPYTTNPDPQVAGHLKDAMDSIVAQDKGGFYEEAPLAEVKEIRAPPQLGPELEQALSAQWKVFHDWPYSDKLVALRHLKITGWILLLWAIILGGFIARRRGDYSVTKRVRATHLLPAAIQVILFAYWALYWDGVPPQLQLIGLQLIFAYAFDALLGLTLFKKWTVSYGPIPITLSANLFVWFPGDHFYLSVIVIALALASKALIRKDGRHIFNPSAVGIAVVGALCLIFPQDFPYIDIAHQLNLAPNMLELIFLLALLPQVRIPIVLVSLAALFTTYTLAGSHAMLLPGPFWPAVFLALVLLATDPATIPKTGGGRVLFGVLLGLVTVLVSSTLEYNGMSDFYGKVLAIPVANFFVPYFDRFASGYASSVERWLGPQHNRYHVALWALLVLVQSHSGVSKQGGFEAVWHRQLDTPHVVIRDNAATCDDNPVWCEPFSLVEEWSLWSQKKP